MEHSTQTRTQAASRLRQWADRPGLRRLADCGLDGALAFVLSAAATGTTPLPVCLGFLASLNADWPALAAAAGGCGGYLLFWGGSACLEPLAGIRAVALPSTSAANRGWWPDDKLVSAYRALYDLVEGEMTHGSSKPL